MKKLSIILLLMSQQTLAQSSWTILQCMQYAVEHNHEVRQSELELDNKWATKLGAIGSFLPSVSANTGAQYNFGRAIDPETNTYTNVSTFYNGYQVNASMPVFDGFNRLHALRAAKASVLMGQSALRRQQDETALAVLQAYTNALYYQGTVAMAEEKVEETTLLLRQTRLLEEVGRKSAADVAQVESQQAEAEYNLIRQQNLYSTALLELKKEMAWPLDKDLEIARDFHDDNLVTIGSDNHDYFVLDNHSALEAVRYHTDIARHEWHQAQSNLYPTISLNLGMNTTYYKTLHSPTVASFSSQFHGNRGEYIGATLSIPIFNRLQTVTGIRRAKNNYRIAQEAYEQKRLELEKLSREAWQDWHAYRTQTTQMVHKVEADSIAYQLTKRQFEEGLSTAIDLRTTSAQLLNSKATLLQCQLMAMVKEQLVRYYKGETIWTE